MLYSVLKKDVVQYSEKGCKAVYWKRMLDSALLKDVVKCTGKLMLYGVLKKGCCTVYWKGMLYSVLKKGVVQCTEKGCCTVYCKINVILLYCEMILQCTSKFF